MVLGNTEEALVDFEHALTCQPLPKDQRKERRISRCASIVEMVVMSKESKLLPKWEAPYL